jgi:hypothetical protein
VERQRAIGMSLRPWTVGGRRVRGELPKKDGEEAGGEKAGDGEKNPSRLTLRPRAVQTIKNAEGETEGFEFANHSRSLGYIEAQKLFVSDGKSPGIISIHRAFKDEHHLCESSRSLGPSWPRCWSRRRAGLTLVFHVSMCFLFL